MDIEKGPTFNCPRCGFVFNLRIKCKNCGSNAKWVKESKENYNDNWIPCWEYRCDACHREFATADAVGFDKAGPANMGYASVVCPSCNNCDCSRNSIKPMKKTGLFKEEPATSTSRSMDL